ARHRPHALGRGPAGEPAGRAHARGRRRAQREHHAEHRRLRGGGRGGRGALAAPGPAGRAPAPAWQQQRAGRGARGRGSAVCHGARAARRRARRGRQAPRDRHASEDGGAVMGSAIIRRLTIGHVGLVLDPLAELQLTRIQKHTRWSLSTSIVLHALLFLWLIVGVHPAPETPPITEISFIEPGDLAAPPPARGPAETSSELSGLVKGDHEVHFRRETPVGDLRLDPQSSTALDDRLNARLAALQGASSAPSPGVAASAPTSMWSSSPATVSASGTGGTSPVALKRGGEGTGPSLQLTHGSSHGLAPALVATPAPAERASEAPA